MIRNIQTKRQSAVATGRAHGEALVQRDWPILPLSLSTCVLYTIRARLSFSFGKGIQVSYTQTNLVLLDDIRPSIPTFPHTQTLHIL